MQHHIFLSYSRKDSDVMRRVHNDLNAEGLTVWPDEGVEPGSDSWRLSVQNAIKKSGCLVAILTPDWVMSEWALAELGYAEALGKKVYLVLARGEPDEVVPPAYAGSQWVDVRHTGHYKPRILKLTRTIRDYLADETRTHPTRPADMAYLHSEVAKKRAAQQGTWLNQFRHSASQFVRRLFGARVE